MREQRSRKAHNNNARSSFFAFDADLRVGGVLFLAGVDEVGRGCLAGPVFAAAVILPPDCLLPGINDSKKLSPQKREDLFVRITAVALEWQVASIDVAEIDRINILRASLLAMRQAVSALKIVPDLVLVDGRDRIDVAHAQRTVIGGDGLSHSIAAASILAKVSRDRYMCEQAERDPRFSFHQHKGYGTAQHLAELREHGPTELHRRSFRGVIDGIPKSL